MFETNVDFVFPLSQEEEEQEPPPIFYQKGWPYMFEILWLSCGCLKGAWKLSGGCLEGVWKVFRECPDGVQRVPGRCPENQDRLSEDRLSEDRSSHNRSINKILFSTEVLFSENIFLTKVKYSGYQVFILTDQN